MTTQLLRRILTALMLLTALSAVAILAQQPVRITTRPAAQAASRVSAPMLAERPDDAGGGGGQQPVRVVDSTGTPVPLATTTELTHGATAPTWTSVVGLTNIEHASATPPTAVTANQPVVPWANLNGARAQFPTANAAGGADSCYVATTASTNSFNCKTSQSTLYDLSAVNTTATIYYLRLYNAASAPTCSAATFFVESIPIPASTTGAGIVRTYPVGRNYSTGISGCVTGGAANDDNTPAAVGVYISLGAK